MSIFINQMPILDGYLTSKVTVSRNVLTEDKGKTLILSDGVVLTFPRNLWKGMGFYVVPPRTGKAILRTDLTFLNYGTKDIILTSANLFSQVLQIDVNSYLISGK